MALTQKLEMRQSQALVMTPQLMQAIKLLQLSNLDLAAYVEGELERNPLLERAGEADGQGADSSPEAIESDDRDAGDRGAADSNAIGDDLETSRSAIEDRLGTDLGNVFPDEPGAAEARPLPEPPAGYSEWTLTGGGGRDGSDYNLESFVSASPTLAD